MNKLKNKLNSLLVIILSISCLAGWYIVNAISPEFNISWYLIIPAFFLIFGLTNIYMLSKTDNKNPRKPVNMFMLFRLMKFVFSFTILGLYYLVNGKENLKEFALIFAIYYIIYLALETFFFFQTEKELKKNM